MATQTGSRPTPDHGRGQGNGTGIDGFFRVSERGSSVRTEVRGGLATFFTMAYIIVLNPVILTGANVAVRSGPKLDFVQVTAVTALVAGVMTILMGILGRVPIALAAGLGLNGVVAYQLAPQMGWRGAMGIVVLEGLVITVLVLTGLRVLVFDAIPRSLKQAISVGIGLFIALIGFVDGGFARRIPGTTGTVPLQLGVGNRLDGWPIVVFTLTLVVMFVLVARRVRGALLIGIVSGTIFAIVLQKIVDVGGAEGDPSKTGWGLNVPKLPGKWFDTPDLALVGKFSIGGAVSAVGFTAVIVFVFSLLLTDFFDTMGTVVGVGGQAGLLDDDGRLPDAQRVLFVDSLAAVAGGAASASSNTAYIESASGVAEGARTGLASVVTGVCFLAALFIAPLVAVIPSEAAAPALVVVGFLMMRGVTEIDWASDDVAIPAFLTIVLMPFTYSITVGIGAGFVAYAVLKLIRGRARDVHWLLWVITAFFLAYFALAPIERALGV
ncbi:MAG: NCS2 family permease [Actinobacteria bacterium]|nr:NCS2 family permease [Actinomycetota bacterium]